MFTWVLLDKERYPQLCAQARDRAVRLWSPEVVVPQYLEVYRQAMEPLTFYQLIVKNQNGNRP
ncbi:MAG: N-acetyl-alpha-D-glucosaminyl L-malate synthase BshA [Endozoicomonadaceae bacterium]|nr:N-acetyl-alpha-D-glucosaminyl L-malate synthase BshA [Endozoicomonadaceae bacterium]